MRRFAQLTIALTLAVVGGVVGLMPVAVAQTGAPSVAAPNYQGLWWNALLLSESGWGINFAHEGDTTFATWYTDDFDGSVLWLSATTPKVDTDVYIWTRYRTTRPRLSAQLFDPNRVMRTPVGTLTLRFSEGNTGTYSYSLYGVTQTESCASFSIRQQARFVVS